ncbi:MAG: HAD-IA family hydrolase [Candidatus Omnitrophica bacterium]|nr:HAD-IA family hydrolase [Candidatus Omnitrophota bacterium]
MYEVDIIFFDLDGTLIDSRIDIVNAVNFTLRRNKLGEKGIDEISSYIGTGVGDLIKKSLGEKNGPLFEKSLSVFEGYYKDHAFDNTRLYEGVREILEHFGKKRKIVVTNKKYFFAHESLKRLKIDTYFEAVYGGDNVGCLKPSSCTLEKAMDIYKGDRTKCIMVGDMVVDVLAGKRARMMTCAVTYGIGKRNDIEKAGPDYIIDKISELKNIIE